MQRTFSILYLSNEHDFLGKLLYLINIFYVI